MPVQVIDRLKQASRVQIYWRLIPLQENIISNPYRMESILQVKFFRGKLLQLFQTCQLVQIQIRLRSMGENLTGTQRKPDKSFLEDRREWFEAK